MGNDFSQESERLVESFIAWLPRILGAIAILVVGWILAVVLRSVAERIAMRLGLNRKVHNSPADSYVRRIAPDPAHSLGNLIYWLIIAITITIFIGALNIPVLTGMIAGFYSYVPNILVSILILGLGIAASALVAGVIQRWMGDTPTGKVVSVVVPVIVMSITGFAILEQLKIAPAIVLTTYIAILGAVSLGFAIAFGLGGADAAGQLLDAAYEKGRENMGQVRADIQKGKERGAKDAREARRRAEEQ